MKRTVVLISLGLVLTHFAIAQTTKMLSPLASFGNLADGSIQPPVVDPLFPPMDAANNQRGLACDPVTGQLVLVNTGSGSGGSTNVMGAIYIVDSTYGTNISTLDTNGISGGNYADCAVGVADDGVVYVANQVTVSGSNPFIIYRWNSVWDSNTPPLKVFEGLITPSQRYGNNIDVRGSGTNTQIIIGSQVNSSSGTNVVIFTTADGTNFNANVLATDAAAANFGDGIAFGTSNTFWAKRVGAPLRLMTFDLNTKTAATVAAYDVNNLPGTANLGPLAVDTANGLLAAIEVVTGTTGPEKVWLFDISNSSRGPVLLDIDQYTPNNGNASAPPGFLDFGGGRLYTHVLNNGLLTFSVSTVATPLPTILVQPTATNRVVVGQTVTLAVLAYPDATFKWQKNTSDISGATNASYTIANVQTNDSATYRVVVSNAGGSLNSSNSLLTVINPSDLYHLKLLWSAVAGEASYFNVTGGSAGTVNQRCMAYNALSNELYIVVRRTQSSQDFMIYTVPATNLSATPPPVIKTLSTNGIALPSAAIGLVAIGVAEDGAIYACNMTADGSGGNGAPFRVYRWANSDPATTPVEIFNGDPAGFNGIRWGDTLDVRGSGMNTRILLDNYNAATSPSQRYIAVLRPSDPNLNLTWSASNYFPDTSGGTRIGRSLLWGVGDNCWQLRSGTVAAMPYKGLIESALDLGNTGVIAPGALRGANFDPELVLVGMDFNRKLLVGIHNSSPSHLVELFEGSDLNSPVMIAQYAFPIAAQANNNRIGQVIFAGDYVFALYSQNGVMAFQLRPGPPTAPVFLTDPRNLRVPENGTGTLTALTDQISRYQWQKNGIDISGATNTSYTIGNAQLTHSGNYRVVATNANGAATSAVAVVTVVPQAQLYHLTQIWSNAVLSKSYLTFSANADTPHFRTIAYNALSNQLYLVTRLGGVDTDIQIAVLDPATGDALYNLDTTGIVPLSTLGTNSLSLVAIDVAEDGSVYAGNVCATATQLATFNLYRWSNSAPTTLPVLVYSAEPANAVESLRWGDCMDVRGGGLNTEIIIDDFRNSAGSLGAVLKPTDASLSSFASSPFSRAYGTKRIGRSIQFGPTNSVWQKSWGERLELSSYDLASGTSTVLANYAYPAAVAGMELDSARNLAAAVDFSGVANSTPDKVNFYDISDLSDPMLLSQHNFPTNKQGNDNRISQCLFTPTRVFALNANNGIVAFNLVPPRPPLTIEWAGADLLLSWPATFAGFTLQATPSLPAVSWTNVGTGTIVGSQFLVTNSAPAGTLFYRLSQ